MKFSLCILFFVLFVYCPPLCGQEKKLTGNISAALQRNLLTTAAGDSLTVYLTARASDVPESGWPGRLLARYAPANSVLTRLKKQTLDSLLEQGRVRFADVYTFPKEELTTGAFDLTLNRINFAQSRFPAITGNGVLVSVKEQLMDSTDIDLKGRFVTTGTEAPLQTTHAGIMATIIAGGANTSPYARGAARGASVSSADFATLFPDPDAVYRRFSITVQNHSYGTGIENFYGSDAVAYDMSVWNNPELLHIFSAGNSGTATPESGTYAGIATSATLTGSFRMAKNSISVGHVDSFNNVAAASSRGPAFDGRVKPDLVAFGEDGSSGAAALVSGTAALVQQAYKLQESRTPRASLLKAVLLNTADDIDAAGIDYRSGFGSLNAYEALQAVQKKQYVEDSLQHGDLKKFEIRIPGGAALLKVMVAWTDTAAEVNAATALVNDLDITLTHNATGQKWQPWILNAAPAADSLALPARRGRDTLNTAEQVTITNPPAGAYTLAVEGRRIKTKWQPFSLTYRTDSSNSFQWTYPTKDDALLTGQQHLLRWQTTRTGPAQLSYSLNGTQWNEIGSTDLEKKAFTWLPPDTAHLILIRMRFASGPDVLSDTLTLPKPVALKVGFDCADSALLYWNAQPVPAYQLYTLGEKYLEALYTTPDTLALINKRRDARPYFSVAPIIAGHEGFRSFTINYATQGIGCYISNFLATLQNNQAALRLELGTVRGLAAVHIQKWIDGAFRNIHLLAGPYTASLDYTDSALTQGRNLYRVQLTLTNGKIIYSSTETVFYFPDNPVLFYPNPARPNQPISIAVQESDVYTIFIFDAAGRLVHQQRLEDGLQTFAAFRLAAGVYFVRIQTDAGVMHTQKLLVY